MTFVPPLCKQLQVLWKPGPEEFVSTTELACVDEKLPRLPRKIACRDSIDRDNDASDGLLNPISQVKRDGTRVGALCGL